MDGTIKAHRTIDGRAIPRAGAVAAHRKVAQWAHSSSSFRDGIQCTSDADLGAKLRLDGATAAKIALPRAVGVVISNGLSILGVTPVEEMR